MKHINYLSENSRRLLLESDEIDAKVEEMAEENNELVEAVLLALKEANAVLDAGIEEEEIAEYKNSEEVQDLINEGVLLERNIVKFDKKTRYNQLLKVAILKLAKENNDPLYKKFVLYKKKERFIENRFATIYGTKAAPLAKKMLKDLLKKKTAPKK